MGNTAIEHPSVIDLVGRHSHAMGIEGMREAVAEGDHRQVVALLTGVIESAKVRYMPAPASGDRDAVQWAAAKRIMNV